MQRAIKLFDCPAHHLSSHALRRPRIIPYERGEHFSETNEDIFGTCTAPAKHLYGVADDGTHFFSCSRSLRARWRSGRSAVELRSHEQVASNGGMRSQHRAEQTRVRSPLVARSKPMTVPIRFQLAVANMKYQFARSATIIESRRCFLDRRPLLPCGLRV